MYLKHNRTSLPTLHIIAPFHTVASSAFSHCAFTGKVLRFAKMMHFYGYRVEEYGNEGSESDADQHHITLSRNEYDKLIPAVDVKNFVGNHAVVGSELYNLFCSRVLQLLFENVQKNDIICHPFGYATTDVREAFPTIPHVETGIGYPDVMQGTYHVFESYAWMHYMQGKEQRNGRFYEWVVPNYFDLDEWEVNLTPKGDYVLYFGRITPEKGMDVLQAIAETGVQIVICGQGDRTLLQHSNITYLPPISGWARSELVGNAKCMIMPTKYIEPFGGAGVEGMLCGTPLIAVDYGAFTETIIDGVTGFRCRTLRQFIDSINKSKTLDRANIAQISRSRYSLQACAAKYNALFIQITDLKEKGWYTV